MRNKTWRRVLSICLAIALVLGTVPLDKLGIHLTKEVEAAEKAIPADTAVITDSHIPDSRLLAYVKKKVNTSLGRAADANITYAELKSYTGALKLSEITGASSITQLKGLGFARGASSIDLSACSAITIPEAEFLECQMTSVVLPSTLISLSTDSFRKCEKLETIVFPSSVTTLGDYAFSECSKLDNISIPSTIQRIGMNCFSQCSTLESIAIPTCNVELSGNIFLNCKGLKTVQLPDGMKKIPEGFLSGTESLENVNIPVSVTTICNSAFKGSGIESVDLSACTNLTTLETAAFENADLWDGIKFPQNSLQYIGSLAFDGSGIRSVKLPESIVTLGSSAFVNCDRLLKVELPNNLERLPARCFADCQYLRKVSIASPATSKLISIGSECFADCASLEGTNFIANCTKLTEIGDRAFADCDIMFADGTNYLKNRFNENWETGNPAIDIELALSEDDYTPIGGRFEFENVIIPNSVVTLGDDVFNGSNNVKKAVLGNGITKLPEGTFEGCKMLNTVELPDELESIEADCFRGCRELTTFEFPQNSLLTIGDYAFADCGSGLSLANVSTYLIYIKKSLISEMPTGSVTELTGYTQYSETTTCEELPTLSMDNTYVKEAHFDESVLLTGNYKLTNPNDSTYVAVNVWLRDYSDYTGESSILQIKPLKASPFTGLKNVVIPDSVTDIGKGCFSGCVNLDRVVLSKKMKEIPDNAFTKCAAVRNGTAGVTKYQYKIETNSASTNKKDIMEYQGLTTIVMPDTIEKIGDYAFSECRKLRNFNAKTVQGESVNYMPEEVKTIGKYAFAEDRTISNFYMGSKLTTIGEYAFNRTSAVIDGYEVYHHTGTIKTISVVVPEFGIKKIDFSQCSNLTSIGKYAFSYSNLREVNLGNSKIQELPVSAMTGATYLEGVSLPKTCSSVGADAFKDALHMERLSVFDTTILDTKMLSGYAAYSGGTFGLQVDNSANRITSVAYGAETLLPLYIFKIDTIAVGGIKIEPKAAGEDPIVKGHTTSGLTNLDISLAGLTKGQQAINLQGNLSFPNDGRNAINILVSLDYNVNVTEKQCTNIRFENTNFAVGINKATDGVFLNAIVEPLDMTDAIAWTMESNGSIEMVPVTAQNAVGDTVQTASAKITPVSYGTTPVKMTAGSKNATVNVQVVVPANSMQIAQDSVSLFQGQITTAKVDAVMNYDHNVAEYVSNWANHPDLVRFTSSQPDLVAVDESGNLSLVGSGTGDVTITAKAEGGGKSDTCIVHVYPDHTDYMISSLDATKVYDENSAPVEIFCTNDSKDMKFLVSKTPADSTAPSECKSANMDIAQVSYNATSSILTVTGRKIGETTISFGSKQGEEYGVTKFKVKVRADVTSLRMTTTTTVAAGAKLKALSSVISPLGSGNNSDTIKAVTDNEIFFSSDNESIATVDSTTGEITGVSAGSTTIHAYAQTRTGDLIPASLDIDVFIPEATGVKITGEKNVKVGSSIQMGYELIPSTAQETVSYKVYGASDCVSVTPDGVVTGLKKGTAQIQVLTSNGKAATMTVNVIQPMTSIVVLKNSIALKVGSMYTLLLGKDYNIEPKVYSNGDDKITWSSQNPEIATVGENNGQVKGIAAGIATIVMKTSYGLSTSFTFEIFDQISAIKTDETLSINVGEDYQMKATITPATSTEKYSWKSSDEKIATVSEDGVIHAVKKGACSISVTTVSGKTATCRLTVLQPSKKVVFRTQTISEKTIYMAKGKTLYLKTYMTPTDTTDKVTYKSSKKKIVKVDSKTGAAVAKKTGTAKITAKTTSGKKATLTIKVVSKEINAKKLTIAKKKTIKRNKPVRLTPKCSPKKTTNNLTWTSSKPQIATVNDCGYVTGLKKGKAVITIKGPLTKFVKCKITVK